MTKLEMDVLRIVAGWRLGFHSATEAMDKIKDAFNLTNPAIAEWVLETLTNSETNQQVKS